MLVAVFAEGSRARLLPEGFAWDLSSLFKSTTVPAPKLVVFIISTKYVCYSPLVTLLLAWPSQDTDRLLLRLSSTLNILYTGLVLRV